MSPVSLPGKWNSHAGKVFNSLARLVSNKPWWVLLGALLLLVFSIGVVAVRGLKMETRILDLLPKDDPAAMAYNDILKQYDSASQIIIGVEGGTRAEKFVSSKHSPPC